MRRCHHHLAAVGKRQLQVRRLRQGGQCRERRQFPLGDEMSGRVGQHHPPVAGKSKGVDARGGQGNAAAALQGIDVEFGDVHVVGLRSRR
ncbi:hypothetical protein D3C72_2193380 [compost metagenome]